jgi:hypothetical protein
MRKGTIDFIDKKWVRFAKIGFFDEIEENFPKNRFKALLRNSKPLCNYPWIKNAATYIQWFDLPLRRRRRTPIPRESTWLPSPVPPASPS